MDTDDNVIRHSTGVMIRKCCQAHYGLVIGSRYECMESRSNPGNHIMFKPNPDKPLFTMVVDCECACHNEGDSTMASKKKAAKKKADPKKGGKAKAAKKTAGKKTEPKTNEKREKYNAGKIKVLVKENPKRKGSASHKRFELYTKNKTVGEFLKAGGTQRDLDWDMDKGFVEFKTLKSY